MNPIQQPTSPAQLPAPTDMGAVNLAKAIRTVESNGNFNAQGKSGEFGAYQFLPSTWKAWAGQYLGDPNAQMTPENQNKVAYSKIVDLKSQGYTPEQVASIWNSGSPDYQGNIGVNSKGVPFNTPKYVESVISKFQQLKQGVQNGPTIPNSSQVQPEQPKSVGGFIGNIFGSAGNLVGGLANTIFHPIQTAQNIGTAITHPDQIISALKDRYGSLKNIENTLYTDPVGVALDISTLAGGAGLALKGAEEGSTLARIGELAGKVGEATNPLAAIGKGVGSLAEGAKALGFGAAGLATGEGKTALNLVEDISKSGTTEEKLALSKAISGQDSPERILADLEKEQQTLVNQRRAEYQSSLSKITEGEHTLTTQSVQEIKNTFENQLKSLEIGRNSNTGVLIFDNSILDSDAAAKRIVQQMDKKIEIATANPTPTTLDNLKKFSADAYKPGNPLNTITQPIKAITRDTLNQNVPQYAKMTQGYSQASDLLNEIKDSLGVGGKAKAETVMNKVMSALNENRTTRLGTLEKFNNANLYKARIAGQKLSQFFPGGLAGKVAEIGGIGTLLHPTGLATGLLGTSPKLMGLVAKTIGTTEGQASKIINALSRATGLQPAQLAEILAQANRQTNPQ